jgi:hypothetical protein
MDFKIFKNKQTDADNSKMLLAQPTMLFRTLDPNEYAMIAAHVVTDDDIVRPDRIAVKHYGVTEGLDIILKFNGISDPFSIMPGEVIFIPVDTIPYYKLETPDISEDNPIKNQFLETKRLSKTDQRRLVALKKKYNKETLLPPNVIPVGRKNYEFDGTDVRLGMGPQTDPVVSSILSDINNENDDSANDTLGNEIIIDLNDNLGEDTLNDENPETGDNIDTSGDKTDKADELGGNIPDGTSPSSDNDTDITGPGSPCSK